jgi:hypothetical protein
MMFKNAKPDSIYIFDTSVLYELALGIGCFGIENPNFAPDARRQEMIMNMIRNDYVVIPSVVVVEFFGQFFHERIDVEDYELWYRRRKTLLDQLKAVFFSKDGRLAMFSASPSDRRLMDRVTQKIANETIGKLRERHLNVPVERRNRRAPKFLDGMDAYILEEALAVARKYPESQCKLITTDNGFSLAVNELKALATADGPYDNLQVITMKK